MPPSAAPGPTLSTPSPPTPPQQAMDYVERLLKATRMERIAYLVVTSFAAALLLVSAGALIWNKGADTSTLVGLFGSTGVVTVTTAQILRVWSDAIRLVIPKP
jgi:hypothetical protein